MVDSSDQISSTFTKTEEKELKKALKNILGFRPKRIEYYKTAFTHRSIAPDVRDNNERLEYLGDAIIGAVVGGYLFLKYPAEDEGFLTQMRSKIVSRNSLNSIALRMGLKQLLHFNRQDRSLGRSQIYGNALEALVGAVYLDVGYKKSKKFLFSHLIEPYINMDELEHTEYNFKNKLYTWAQRRDLKIDFKTILESEEQGRKVFVVGVFMGEKELGRGSGYSKKEAGQRAAQQSLGNIEGEGLVQD